MFRFSIRDVLWLTVVVAMGCAWLYERNAHNAAEEARRFSEFWSKGLERAD